MTTALKQTAVAPLTYLPVNESEPKLAATTSRIGHLSVLREIQTKDSLIIDADVPNMLWLSKHDKAYFRRWVMQ